MTHTTWYLYGITPQDLEGKEYYEALEFKREHGDRLFKKLYTMDRNNSEDVQMHYVLKALHHTEELINERYAV